MRQAKRQGIWIREERAPSLAELEWLASPEGREVCREMAAGQRAATPAEIEHWRRRIAPEQVTAAWAQVELRAAAAEKFSRSADMLFDCVGLEQATGEAVAEHKARRFAGFEAVADLCCGIGGDAIALAAGRRVVAVDWSDTRLFMARHNAGVYGRELQAVRGEAAFQRPSVQAVHIDPDRRPGGGRKHDPNLSSPDLETIARIVAHYTHAAVKLSPGADLDSLPLGGEIELISDRGECKQAVVWTGRLAQAWRRATVLPGGEQVVAQPGESLVWPAPREPAPGLLLLEPDPAVIRANLVGVLARRLGLAPVDPLIAWLVGENCSATTLVRQYRIIDVLPWSRQRARGWLAAHDIGQVEIKTRGFAARPEEILRQLRPSGSGSAVLFLTRIGRRPTAILADRLLTEERRQ